MFGRGRKMQEILRSELVREPEPLFPGSVLDKFEFRQANDKLAECVRVTVPGDGDFAEGTIVPRETLEQVNAQIDSLGGTGAEGAEPKIATATTQLLGIGNFNFRGLLWHDNGRVNAETSSCRCNTLGMIP